MEKNKERVWKEIWNRSILKVLWKPLKMAKELREKADKGEATARDAMAALMLAAIMKEESKED